MKINLIKFLMGLVALLIFAPQAHAYDFEVDGIYYDYLSKEDRTVKVTGSRYKGELEIPKKIIVNGNSYMVTEIGYEAFNERKDLTSVIIPTSVITIRDRAFMECGSLTSMNIPNSVTTIGNYAFAYCSSLPSVNIPNSVTTIGKGAFYYCTGLPSVNIPNSVTTIGNHAFYGCIGLKSLTISSSVTKIGSDTFGDCRGLTSVTIPNSVTTIGNSAFYYCTGLTSLTIPGSVTKIGVNAFKYCSPRQVYCHWEDPIECNNIFDNYQIKEAILYVPKGCMSTYKKVDPWRNFGKIEEASYSGITEISADGLNISVTDGVINIDCVGSETLVEVFDIAGKTVYRGYGHTVTGLSNGIYIVKVGSQTRKIRI